MTAVRILPAIALALLLAPVAGATEPSQAAAVWQQEHGSADVAGLDLAAVPADAVIEGRLRFDPAFALDRVSFQVCEVGQACFAIGVPMHDEGDGVWRFSMADVEAHLGFPPPEFAAGDRIGFQFFVYLPNSTGEDDFLFFPEGEECDIHASQEEWVACQETHYFAITMLAAERTTPGPGIVLVAGLAILVAWARRK